MKGTDIPICCSNLMSLLKRPLVLVHGLWNNEKIFRVLLTRMQQPESLLFTPYLPHGSGRVNIRELARNLDDYINEQFASTDQIDLLGFSMGGLVSRVWLQELGGFRRTRRFFSIGSPHNGTLTAQPMPHFLFPGIAEMKVGSGFIKTLNKQSRKLQRVNCRSYYCPFDLMVLPGPCGVLPMGPSISVPVLYHKALVTNSMAVELLVRDLLTDCI
ncbi:lipase [Prochlorococcus sp. MIT 0602]|nr:lipase [Prochlorococcus sp. MIT 0602]KGG17673.1 lipase [Prochlorococcus sp. MIT 0603]